jgi:hypothetical protein
MYFILPIANGVCIDVTHFQPANIHIFFERRKGLKEKVKSMR